jgi:hypothetical protein
LKLEYVAIPVGEGVRRPVAVWTFFMDFITHYVLRSWNTVVVKSLGPTTSLCLPLHLLQNYDRQPCFLVSLNQRHSLGQVLVCCNFPSHSALTRRVSWSARSALHKPTDHPGFIRPFISIITCCRSGGQSLAAY